MSVEDRAKRCLQCHIGLLFWQYGHLSLSLMCRLIVRKKQNKEDNVVQNSCKEVGLTTVHRAMDGLAPTTHQHCAGKAECHRNEFPFLYWYYKVTDIPDHHTDGGDAMVSCFVFTTQSIPTDLTSLHSVTKAPFCLQSSVRHWQYITTNLAKLSQSLCLDLRLTSNFMLQLVLMLFVQLQYV